MKQHGDDQAPSSEKREQPATAAPNVNELTVSNRSNREPEGGVFQAANTERGSSPISDLEFFCKLNTAISCNKLNNTTTVHPPQRARRGIPWTLASRPGTLRPTHGRAQASPTQHIATSQCRRLAAIQAALDVLSQPSAASLPPPAPNTTPGSWRNPIVISPTPARPSGFSVPPMPGSKRNPIVIQPTPVAPPPARHILTQQQFNRLIAIYRAFEATNRRDASTQTEEVFIISALSTPIGKPGSLSSLETPISATSSGYEASCSSPQNTEAKPRRAGICRARVVVVVDSDDEDANAVGSPYLTTPNSANSSGYEASCSSPQEPDANLSVSHHTVPRPAPVILVPDSDDEDANAVQLTLASAQNPATNKSPSHSTLNWEEQFSSPIYVPTPELKSRQRSPTPDEHQNHYDIYGQYEDPQTLGLTSRLTKGDDNMRGPEHDYNMDVDEAFDAYSEFDWDAEFDGNPDFN